MNDAAPTTPKTDKKPAEKKKAKPKKKERRVTRVTLVSKAHHRALGSHSVFNTGFTNDAGAEVRPMSRDQWRCIEIRPDTIGTIPGVHIVAENAMSEARQSMFVPATAICGMDLE